ncbi:MAG TPA: TIGR01620 family protein [Geminicoccaceae bacterium]|nr:TIGR01620 family protein [Geminicoccaceae bacterium]
MSRRERIAPFELDPTTLDPSRLELVEPEPAPAPLVPAPEPPPTRARPWRRLLLWGGALSLLALLGLEAYDLLAELFARSVWFGGALALLLGITLAGALGLVGRELNSLRRLARAEHLRQDGERLLHSEVHGQAGALLARIERLYDGRAELQERLASFRGQASDALSDGEQLRLFAATVLGPLDQSAYQIVRRGARDIGALTALSPLGLLDGVLVLARTLAMLRAIARLYGVRPGALASLSLLRRTLRNVLAAGVGELMSDAAVEATGATLLSTLSARAGQGVVNGLLAAKLGLAAMQLCRPLPFTAAELPSLRQLRTELFK